jgi:hypothetical protein
MVQPQSLAICEAKAREAMLGPVELSAVAERPRSDAPERRIRPKRPHQRPEASRLESCVGIQEQHELGCAGGDPEVAAVGKATVLRCPDRENVKVGNDGRRVVG